MDTLKLILSLIGTAIDILFPLATILFVVGVVVRFSGGAPNIREGIIVVLKFLKNAWQGESVEQPDIAVFYDEEQLKPLTERLSKYFTGGVVFSFCKKNKDLILVKYEIGEATNFHEKLAETDVKNFFRQIDNLHPGMPIHIFVYLFNDELSIYRGLSEKGIQYVQEQKYNEHSRKIDKKQGCDLVE